MKKLFIAIVFITLFASVCFADWAPTSAVINKSNDWRTRQVIYEIKIVLESDGSDPSEFTLSDYLSSDGMRMIEGGLFYDVETDQGTTAPGTYTVTFDNEKGADILSVTTTSTSQSELWSGSNDLGYKPAIWDLQIDFGDVGNSGDDIVLYIRILK